MLSMSSLAFTNSVSDIPLLLQNYTEKSWKLAVFVHNRRKDRRRVMSWWYFTWRKPRLYDDDQPLPAEYGVVTETQRIALTNAVLARGLELHHQGPCENL